PPKSQRALHGATHSIRVSRMTELTAHSETSGSTATSRNPTSSGSTATAGGVRPTLTALVVLTGVFLSSLDLFIVNIAFPSISKSFHGESLSSMSWVLSAYTIVFAALLVPAGRWADRAGRKRAFLLGLGLFTVSSALCAIAPSLDLLVAARILQASGGA